MSIVTESFLNTEAVNVALLEQAEGLCESKAKDGTEEKGGTEGKSVTDEKGGPETEKIVGMD